MMKVSLWLFTILVAGPLTQQSCSQETVSSVNEVVAINCPEAGAFVKDVKSAKGIVWYSSQRQQYYVIVPTGTIDSVVSITNLTKTLGASLGLHTITSLWIN